MLLSKQPEFSFHPPHPAPASYYGAEPALCPLPRRAAAGAALPALPEAASCAGASRHPARPGYRHER